MTTAYHPDRAAVNDAHQPGFELKGSTRVDTKITRLLSESVVTSVSTTAELRSALTGSAGTILLAAGTYYLSEQLEVNRDVTIKAAVTGTVSLSGQAISLIRGIYTGFIFIRVLYYRFYTGSVVGPPIWAPKSMLVGPPS